MSAQTYYCKQEMSHHNSRLDCWVSAHGRVFNYSALFSDGRSPDATTDKLLIAAGSDVSHWWRQDAPDNDDNMVSAHRGKPSWWMNPQYEIGRLSQMPRKVRVLNATTGQEVSLMVCGEDTVGVIQKKFMPYNAHSGSYTWKALLKGSDQSTASAWAVLDLSKTLHDNGVTDDRAELERLGLDADADAMLVTILCGESRS